MFAKISCKLLPAPYRWYFSDPWGSRVEGVRCKKEMKGLAKTRKRTVAADLGQQHTASNTPVQCGEHHLIPNHKGNFLLALVTYQWCSLVRFQANKKDRAKVLQLWRQQRACVWAGVPWLGADVETLGPRKRSACSQLLLLRRPATSSDHILHTQPCLRLI